MTTKQALHKLQLAVDHIAAVMEAPITPDDAVADLSEALDQIHYAESAIEGDDD